ncbi:heavy metal-binding protein HIP-like isoform X2 [Scomber japonicus]|uniref:heavy metal-binding protein HIP-like isoform X2 n=1 Tax=Scomber japonicus TaxID=13676 RepID=UPI002305BBFA|nr:heavy metal-binding protein HIP-like isoform X2 [Scomber japonicus]
MAIEHSVELRNSKSKMEKLEQENTVLENVVKELQRENTVLEARMNASENEVEELKRQNADLLDRVTSFEDKNKVLEARMNTSENEVVKLKIESADLLDRVTSFEDKNKVLEARMNASENEVEELKRQNADLLDRVTSFEDKNKVLEARMNASENEVEELKRQNADQPKVAFSLGLTDNGLIGPFDTDITLKFSKVITNFGQVYSPSTGLFTAPVRGAYYFSFTTLDGRSNVFRRVYLYRNDKRVLFSYNYSSSHRESVSNSLVLQLEKGDVVYLVLPAGHSVFDDASDFTSFNGFLLFPL